METRSIVVGIPYMFLTEYVVLTRYTTKTKPGKYSGYIPNDPFRRKITINEDIAKKYLIPSSYTRQLDYVWDLYFDIKYLSELLWHIKKGFPCSSFSKEDFLDIAHTTENTYLLGLYEKYSQIHEGRKKRENKRFLRREYA